VANAQLYNEKTALIYQVEGLKDRCVCGGGGMWVYTCVFVCVSVVYVCMHV